jgi:hypothetical protein
MVDKPCRSLDLLARHGPMQRCPVVRLGIQIGAAVHKQRHRLDAAVARRIGQSLAEDFRRVVARPPWRKARVRAVKLAMPARLRPQFFAHEELFHQVKPAKPRRDTQARRCNDRAGERPRKQPMAPEQRDGERRATIAIGLGVR